PILCLVLTGSPCEGVLAGRTGAATMAEKRQTAHRGGRSAADVEGGRRPLTNDDYRGGRAHGRRQVSPVPGDRVNRGHRRRAAAGGRSFPGDPSARAPAATNLEDLWPRPTTSRRLRSIGSRPSTTT